MQRRKTFPSSQLKRALWEVLADVLPAKLFIRPIGSTRNPWQSRPTIGIEGDSDVRSLVDDAVDG